MAAGQSSVREAREVFLNSVRFVLGNWPAVRVAVEQGFGGKHSSEKARWLEEVVFSLFVENEIIDSLDVEDYLAEILSNEFNILIEDESLPKVAQTLCSYYQSCKNGDYSSVAAEIMSIKLPKLNIKCHDSGESDTMNISEHGTVARQLENLNLGSEPCSSVNMANEQSPGMSGLDNDSNREEAKDDQSGWVVVQRSKRKH